MQDFNKYLFGIEEQPPVMRVHVLDVHIHLKKGNLDSWFSAKPFVRLVVSSGS